VREKLTRYRALVVVTLALAGVATAINATAAHRTPRPVQTGRPPDPADLINRAERCRFDDDDAGAITYFSAAIRIDPRNVWAYLGRGKLRCGSGDADGAIADFKAVLRLDPVCARAYYERAVVYKGKQQFDQALADLNESIRFDATNGDAFCLRANIWWDQGERAKAVADWNQSVRHREVWVGPGKVRPAEPHGASGCDCEVTGGMNSP
jgi:tetratricopeptide (TPR) repeat protein